MISVSKIYRWITSDTASSIRTRCECDDCLDISYPSCPNCYDDLGIIIECDACLQQEKDYELANLWHKMYKISPAQLLLHQDLAGREHFLKYHVEDPAEQDIPF